IEFISNIVRLYRGEEIETTRCSFSLLKEYFPDLKYRDVKGLCKIATIEDIQNQGWSLNPGRYVGHEEADKEEESIRDKMRQLAAELSSLMAESKRIENRIIDNLRKLGYVQRSS
ncbi:MAG: SAM-dependent DNA methyltransferase, partial [Candidatus Hodarchaeales archaeon]